jgi:hypothetical protein
VLSHVRFEIAPQTLGDRFRPKAEIDLFEKPTLNVRGNRRAQRRR